MVKELYSEKYRILKKETEEDTNKCKHIPPCSWIRKMNIIKMSTLPKAIYRFKAMPIKIPMVTSGQDGGISKFSSPPCITMSKLQLHFRTTIRNQVEWKSDNYGIKDTTSTLAGVAQWLERQPLKQRVVGLIPSQVTCLGARSPVGGV